MPVGIPAVDHSSEPRSPSPLLSPSARGHHHPCHVRLFSGDDVPLGMSIPGRGDAFNTGVLDQREGGAENSPEFQRQSSTGSINELKQGSGEKEKPQKQLAKTPSSEDDDDTFEDAHEELKSSGTPPADSISSSSLLVENFQNNISVPEEGSPSRESIVQTETWKKRRKHIFILSEAGKPIYSQYGDEDELASLMAVMQAMVSYVLDMGDNLKTFQIEGNLIVFLTKGPLILVAVSRGDESPTQLNMQLT